MTMCKDDGKGTEITILAGGYPEPRQLTASWKMEDVGSLWDSFGIYEVNFWEWRFLWNWKAAYKKYQRWKLGKELAEIMADEIRKELDAELINQIKLEIKK